MIKAFINDLAKGKYQDQPIGTVIDEAKKIHYLNVVPTQLSIEQIEEVRTAAMKAINENEILSLSHHLNKIPFFPPNIDFGAIRCAENRLWTRRHAPKQKDTTKYHVPAAQPDRILEYDLDRVFKQEEDAKLIRFLLEDSDLGKHARAGTGRLYFPCLVLVADSEGHLG